jgi:hypothetical protein
VIANLGKFAGTSILQEEQNRGLAMVNALAEPQRKKAIPQGSKTGNENVAEARGRTTSSSTMRACGCQSCRRRSGRS